MDALFSAVIVVSASLFLAWRSYRALSGRDNTCGCVCTCNIPRTAACGSCTLTAPRARGGRE